MGAQFVNKFLKVIGISGNEEEAYEENYDENYNEEYTEEIEDDDAGMYNTQSGRRGVRASVRDVEDANNKQTKVISVNNGISSSKMVITQPTCYNDVEEVGTYLKSKKSVIINLENVGKEDARRVLDFLSGATFMIEGNIQKVSSLIYLMTPRTVEIQNDLENAQMNKQQQEQRQSFSWLK